MSKTLDAMTFGDWVWGGATGFAQYHFSDDFVDENGVAYSAKSYLEVATTISGRVVTIPAYPNFPETEAAVLNNGVTVTCHLLDSNRVKKAILFDSVRIYTSLPSTVSLSQLVLANGASRLLRDSDVWTKEQTIDYINTLPPAAKMTALAFGVGRLRTPADDPTDPELIGSNDPRIGGHAPNALYAGDYVFETTSSTPITTVGVRDPVDHELNATFETGGALIDGGTLMFFTYTNASGETLPSNVRGMAPATNSKMIVESPPASTNATGWNFYAIKGGFTSATKQNASPIAIGTDYTASSLITGATYPTSNTTGGVATVTVEDGSFIFAPASNGDDVESPSRVYQALLIDEGTANEEYVYVLAKPSANSFTATFAKTHSAGFTVKTATGGIQEAIMALPSAGGTVIVPPSTVIKAPIMLRYGLRLVGTVAGPSQFGFGGSKIIFHATDPGIGALIQTGWRGTAFPIYLQDLTVQSQTNALYAQGILGVNVNRCLLNGDAHLTGAHNFGTSGVRASYGTGLINITDSTIGGSPAINVYGAFLLGLTLYKLFIGIRGEYVGTGNRSRGIVIDAKAGPGGTGPAAGGFIRIKDTLTENGNGTPLDLADVNADVEQFDIADIAEGGPFPEIKWVSSTTAAISTLRFSRIVAGAGSFATVATFQFSQDTTFEATPTVPRIVIDETQFNVYATVPAIDAGSMNSGSLIVTRSIGVDLALRSGKGSLANPPLFGGVDGWGNIPPAGGLDGVIYGLLPARPKITSLETLGSFTFASNTPAQITSQKDNYDPGSAKVFQKWSSDASRSVTGIDIRAYFSESFPGWPPDGTTLLIVNVGGFNIVLKHDDASSSTENQLYTTTGADITLAPNQQALCMYDRALASGGGGWRCSKMN